MPVHIENMGGGGGRIFPPAGTQVADFNDDFNRADAGTLGSAWGMAWGYADTAVGSEPFNPQSCAVNPRIENNRVIWWSRREGYDNIGRGYSLAWPWPLGWMTQAKFDQYSEVEVIRIDRSPDTVPVVATVYSGNFGSMDPDEFGQHWDTDAPPAEQFQGRFGFYSMDIFANPDGTSPSFGLTYNLFGGNPGTLPDGLRGHAGINYLALNTTYVNEGPLAPLPGVFRLEARWVTNQWQFRGLYNGELVATASHNHLIQGCPAMGMSAYYTGTAGFADPNNMVRVDNYKGGWLR